MASKISHVSKTKSIILIVSNDNIINYLEAMFEGYFTYNHKGPCYIYYLETEEQKERNKELIEELNNNEIEAECREVFTKQEREKKEKWDKLGHK